MTSVAAHLSIRRQLTPDAWHTEREGATSQCVRWPSKDKLTRRHHHQQFSQQVEGNRTDHGFPS